MPPEQVEIIPDRRKIVAGYRWKTPDGKDDTYPASEVFHIRTRNPASIYRGMGFLPRLREQIIMDRSLRQYKVNQVRMGIPTTIVFNVKRGFGKEEDFQRFQDEMWQRMRGPHNAGKPLWVRDGDVELEVIPRPTENEIAILANLKYTRNEIAMLFGVPPSRLSDYSETFRANASEQGRTFIQDTIMSWHALFIAAMNQKFLPTWFGREMRTKKLEFAYDYSQVRALALSMRDMAQVNTMLIDKGMRTPNEGAVSVGDAMHEDPAADKLYMNGKELGAKAPKPAPAGKPGNQPGELDPANQGDDGKEPDESQDDEGRVLTLVTKGGTEVDIESMWLACGKLKRSEESSDGTRRIYGIASTDSVDRQKTIVDQNTLQAAAKKWHKNNGKVFYNHEWNSLPMGRSIAVDFEEHQTLLGTEVGRNYDIVTGFWGLSKTPVNDVWSAIEQKMVSSYSIAFNADKHIELDADGEQIGPTILKVTDVFEVSVVSIPANPDAEFGIVKAATDPVFQKMLRGESRPRPRDTANAGGGLVIPDDSLKFALEDNANLDGEELSRIEEELETWQRTLMTSSKS
jgi:HK97 family phage portal protein/HK97 family phage prohead protease